MTPLAFDWRAARRSPASLGHIAAAAGFGECLFASVIGDSAAVRRANLGDAARQGTAGRGVFGQQAAAARVALSAEDLDEIEQTASKIVVQGARLPEAVLKYTNG